MLGVLGGMGPLATADFLAKVAAATPAATDQEHIPVIAWSVPQIPPRIPAIFGKGQSPLPAMLEGIRTLKNAGAEGVAIACNTAHYWFDQLQSQGGLPMLHIADAALAEAKRGAPTAKVLGLLATEGTLAAGFYQQRIEAAGCRLVLPIAADQALLGQSIDMVKAGDVAAAARIAEPVVRRLLDAGAERIIVGCTELPIALAACSEALKPQLIDATAALATACVGWSRS